MAKSERPKPRPGARTLEAAEEQTWPATRIILGSLAARIANPEKSKGVHKNSKK
jgi:hypothetical protein